jgi:hypothetical protein
LTPEFALIYTFSIASKDKGDDMRRGAPPLMKKDWLTAEG